MKTQNFGLILLFMTFLLIHYTQEQTEENLRLVENKTGKDAQGAGNSLKTAVKGQIKKGHLLKKILKNSSEKEKAHDKRRRAAVKQCGKSEFANNGNCTACSVKYYGCATCNTTNCFTCLQDYRMNTGGVCANTTKNVLPSYSFEGIANFEKINSRRVSFNVYLRVESGLIYNSEVRVTVIEAGRNKSLTKTITCPQVGNATGPQESQSNATKSLAKFNCDLTYNETITANQTFTVTEVTMIKINGETSSDTFFRGGEVISNKTDNSIEEEVEEEGFIYTFNEISSQCIFNGNQANLILNGNINGEQAINKFCMLETSEGDASCNLKKEYKATNATLNCLLFNSSKTGFTVHDQRTTIDDNSTLHLIMSHKSELCRAEDGGYVNNSGCGESEFLDYGTCTPCFTRFNGCQNCSSTKCFTCLQSFKTNETGVCINSTKIVPPSYSFKGFGNFDINPKNIFFNVYFKVETGFMVNSKIRVTLIIYKGRNLDEQEPTEIECPQNGIATGTETSNPSASNSLAKFDCNLDDDAIVGNEKCKATNLNFININGEDKDNENEKNFIEGDGIEVSKFSTNEIEEEAKKQGSTYIFNELSGNCKYNGNKADFTLTGTIDTEQSINGKEYTLKTSGGDAKCNLNKDYQETSATLTCSLTNAEKTSFTIGNQEKNIENDSTLSLKMSDESKELCKAGEGESNRDDSSSSSGLSGGAIAGIVIACVVVVAIIGGIIAYLVFRGTSKVAEGAIANTVNTVTQDSSRSMPVNNVQCVQYCQK